MVAVSLPSKVLGIKKIWRSFFVKNVFLAYWGRGEGAAIAPICPASMATPVAYGCMIPEAFHRRPASLTPGPQGV